METRQLYKETIDKFDVYHLHVNHTASDSYWPGAQETFGSLLPKGHLRRVTVDEVTQAIVDIVTEHAGKQENIAWQTAKEPKAAQGWLRRMISW